MKAFGRGVEVEASEIEAVAFWSRSLISQPQIGGAVGDDDVVVCREELVVLAITIKEISAVNLCGLSER